MYMRRHMRLHALCCAYVLGKKSIQTSHYYIIMENVYVCIGLDWHCYYYYEQSREKSSGLATIRMELFM